MKDLAVKLDGFPQRFAEWQAVRGLLLVQRTEPSMVQAVADWVRSKFSRGWRNQYLSAATNGHGFHASLNGVVGFAGYDTPRLGFFGPLGVSEDVRGGGIGTGLTLAALAAMEADGYGFAMIHHVGPIPFYAKFLKFTVVNT